MKHNNVTYMKSNTESLKIMKFFLYLPYRHIGEAGIHLNSI